MAETVIVRGMPWKDWGAHCSEMRVYFGGRTQAASTKPTRDARYIAFYQKAPRSAITHLGIVSRIERNADLLKSDVFHLGCLIALDPPIPCGHSVSNFLYATLDELGISRARVTLKRDRSVTFR